jgi:FAD/FMN-containing dehydrogenase
MSYMNFNELYTIKPKNYFVASTLKELNENMENSSKPVRIIGGVHVFNDLSMTDKKGTIIDTKKLNDVLNVNTNDKIVTVQSGTTLKKLLKHLEKYNLSLPVMTATNAISIAGGISTGAHGSNILNGSLSSLVTSIGLITNEGMYKYIDNTNEEELKAVKCSLGCLGAIYSISLKCVDMFSIKETVYNDYWNNIYSGLDILLTKYPYTQIDLDQFSDNLLSTVTLRQKVPYDSQLGPGYKVLTSYVSSWYIEIELAFPYYIVDKAVKAICKFHINYKETNNIFSESQLLIRFSGEDDTLISMASGRKTVYISSFFEKEYEPKLIYKFMHDLSDKMVNEYKARPHYGKQNNLSKEQMKLLYGKNYDTFAKIHKKYDATDTFSNEYIKRIL